MKSIIFTLALLKFTFSIKYTYENASVHEDVEGNAEPITCEDKKFPGNPNGTSYDYCRSLYIDKETSYRCCYAKADNNKGGCVLTEYSDFQDEDSIKKKIEGYDNAEIDCSAKFLGVSLIALIITLL